VYVYSQIMLNRERRDAIKKQLAVENTVNEGKQAEWRITETQSHRNAYQTSINIVISSISGIKCIGCYSFTCDYLSVALSIAKISQYIESFIERCYSVIKTINFFKKKLHLTCLNKNRLKY